MLRQFCFLFLPCSLSLSLSSTLSFSSSFFFIHRDICHWSCFLVCSTMVMLLSCTLMSRRAKQTPIQSNYEFSMKFNINNSISAGTSIDTMPVSTISQEKKASIVLRIQCFKAYDVVAFCKYKHSEQVGE